MEKNRFLTPFFQRKHTIHRFLNGDFQFQNTHLSYIPPMLMLKIYRSHWTQCDDNTLHDPLGLVMVR